MLRGRWRRPAVVAAILVPPAAAGIALASGEQAAVVVRDRSGEELAREPLPESGRFELAYRHSYYGAPAREVFRAGGGGFALRAIRSPSAAVLDYYALAGRRTRARGRLELVLSEPRRYRRLALIATQTGRRTLVTGGRRVPLWGRRARHLTLTVERGW